MQRTKLSLLIAALLAAPCSYADDAELRARVVRLEAEVQALTRALKQIDAKAESIAIQQEARASAGGATVAETIGPAFASTTIYGYGELNYTHPRASSQTLADLRRAVFGFGHRFDDDTRFISEFEFEHAVASASDRGEAEVEQFYTDHRLAQNTNAKAGLFLIPAGLLNESHEPTHYYGVERNFVETAIIPSTWREGGVGVYGSTDFGLAWDTGVTTGFNLAKWDSSNTSGCQVSPLGCVHQEMQLANAKDISVYAALNWRGTPGLVVGASLFTGGAGQGGQGYASAPVLAVAGDRVLLWGCAYALDAGPLGCICALRPRIDFRHGKLQPDPWPRHHAHSQRVLRLVRTGGLSLLGIGQALAVSLRPLRTLQYRERLRSSVRDAYPQRAPNRSGRQRWLQLPA